MKIGSFEKNVSILLMHRYFDVFDFELLQGESKAVLREPNSVVITETTGRKYFGDEEPIGRVIIFDQLIELKITGVARNVPHNSHFHFDFLASFETARQHPSLQHMFDEGGKWWSMLNHSYFLFY